MDITFECPHCGQSVAIDEAGAGLQIDCPGCRSSLTVPSPSTDVSPPTISTGPDPQYRCNSSQCSRVWSKHELLREHYHGRTILLCPECRRSVTEMTQPGRFWSRVPEAFAYPLRGGGIWILVSGTLLLGLPELIQNLMGRSGGPVGFILGLIGGACVGWLLIDIIRTTADDEERPMEWPEIPRFEDLREVLTLLLGSAMVVFAPAIIGSAFQVSNIVDRRVVVVLWTLSTAYYPMALLAVAMFDSLSGVNPLIVVPAIIRTLPQYLFLVLLLGMMWFVTGPGAALAQGSSAGWQLVLYLPFEFLSLYSLAVTARLLGLLYHYNADRLHWLE